MIKVSIIVFTVDQSSPARRCMDSLLSQSVEPGDYEILVVGRSPYSFQEQEKSSSASVRCVPVWNGQLVKGLNQAVAEANGLYCLFVAANALASPRLVFEHLTAQQSSKGMIGLGAVLLPLSAKNPGTRKSGVSWIESTPANLSIPRSAILGAGGFREELSKSFTIELAYRLTLQGLPVKRVDAAIVTLDQVPARREVLRYEEERGAAYVELWKKHPGLLPLLFGNFYDTSPRGVVLRRLLIACAIRSSWIAALSGWFRNGPLNGKLIEFLQQLAFWQGAHHAVSDRKIWRQLTHGVPILMYHAFCEREEHAGRYVHSIQKFKVQLRCLKLLGYQVIRLEDYLESLLEAVLPPGRSVIITMDDGYADNPKVAFPVLRQLHAPATIFLVSNYLGRVNDWDESSELTGRQLFSLEEAREWQNDLIDFGSHTHTHPWLGNLPSEQAREEITRSKAELERQLGSSILVFSYPHGDYNELTPRFVEGAGYLGACTTTTGLNTPATYRFTLKRTEIRGNYSLIRFLRAVWFGK